MYFRIKNCFLTTKKIYSKKKLQLLVLSFSLLSLAPAFGQFILEEEPKRLYFERISRVKKFKDMKDFRDVFHYNKLLMGKNRISGHIAFNMGRVVIEDADHVKHNEVRSAISFFTRIRFFEQFSLNTTFYKDFNPRAAARWTSNYTYSVARYNWRPNKFNYGYENYLNNRYTDSWQQMKEKFMEGYYFISYGHNAKKLTDKIKIDSTSNMKFLYFARYAVKYRLPNDSLLGGLTSGKPTVGMGLRMTLFWNIYIESAVYYYFQPFINKQQPWDPDYSYGFGYFDWRSFRCSISYGNWAVNRFPGRKVDYPNYGFLDGNFRFAINWIW